ncbi:MAG: Na+/H+ antiporter subunit E [Elusimicrobia bacterium]|nr:Na+/H+ antiporter subunit E [Elusimicrobiota bacterium]
MKKLTLFFIAFAIWILLTLPFDIQNFTLGLAAAFLVAMIFGEYFLEIPQKSWNPRRWFWFLYYIPVFAYYMVLANLDVAWRVLHPRLPIKPGIVKIRTKLKSKAGRTALANSITLTPGTLTVDIIGEFLYIHWISVKSQNTEEATEKIAGRFERILARIFE